MKSIQFDRRIPKTYFIDTIIRMPFRESTGTTTLWHALLDY